MVLNLRTAALAASLAVAGGVVGAPATAAPLDTVKGIAAGAAPAEYTQYRGWRGRGYYGRPYGYRRYGYRRGGYGAAVGAGIAGLAAGAILGSALSAQAAPPPVGYVQAPNSDWVAYCSSKYKSFDPASGTYLGYDGLRHACQ